MSNYSLIDQFLSDNLDSFINATIQLCRQPSVSATGYGVRECARLVETMLRQHGCEVQVFETPGNPVLVGKLKGTRNRTLLFYNHYDVQPPEPLELWTSPPFDPTIRDGFLYARGVSDDKGEFISRLAAVDAARYENGGELPCNVIFVLEGEEEIGSPNIASFVLEHLDILKSDAAIWEVGGVDHEGRPGTSLGARGILTVEISLRTMSRDAHSGSAHALPSAAWRMVRLLSCLKDEQENILVPGWNDSLQPATSLDLEYLAALPRDEEIVKQELGFQEFLLGKTGLELDKTVFNPTCNIQGITTGYQGSGIKTVIPATATVKLDFRLVPEQTPDDLYPKLRAHLDACGFSDAILTRHGSMNPYKASADDPFIHLAQRLAPEVYGHSLLINPMAGGSSPIYAFAGPLGDIPVLWAGVGGPNGRAHSPDENIEIKNFLSGARYIARILSEF